MNKLFIVLAAWIMGAMGMPMGLSQIEGDKREGYPLQDRQNYQLFGQDQYGQNQPYQQAGQRDQYREGGDDQMHRRMNRSRQQGQNFDYPRERYKDFQTKDRRQQGGAQRRAPMEDPEARILIEKYRTLEKEARLLAEHFHNSVENEKEEFRHRLEEVVFESFDIRSQLLEHMSMQLEEKFNKMQKKLDYFFNHQEGLIQEHIESLLSQDPVQPRPKNQF